MSLAAVWVSLHTAFPYVAAAYIVVLAVILIYVAIMARRLTRSGREIARLRAEYEAQQAAEAQQATKGRPGAGSAGGSAADALARESEPVA
jgi:membrane protein implicated in regulation of membrane protease activity